MNKLFLTSFVVLVVCVHLSLCQYGGSSGGYGGSSGGYGGSSGSGGYGGNTGGGYGGSSGGYGAQPMMSSYGGSRPSYGGKFPNVLLFDVLKV